MICMTWVLSKAANAHSSIRMGSELVCSFTAKEAGRLDRGTLEGENLSFHGDGNIRSAQSMHCISSRTYLLNLCTFHDTQSMLVDLCWIGPNNTELRTCVPYWQMSTNNKRLRRLFAGLVRAGHKHVLQGALHGSTATHIQMTLCSMCAWGISSQATDVSLRRIRPSWRELSNHWRAWIALFRKV